MARTQRGRGFPIRVWKSIFGSGITQWVSMLSDIGQRPSRTNEGECTVIVKCGIFHSA